LAISTQITAVFYAKFDNNIGFQEKKPVFAVIWQKSVKIVNISLTPVGILFKMDSQGCVKLCVIFLIIFLFVSY
jgi:hypothetical protein